MIPLVDVHCHLLPGLDDGPETWSQAIEMCRMAWDDGTRAIAATAHQNPRWPGVTPATIQHATSELDRRLIDQGIPLSVYPTAEVMVGPDTEVDLQAGRLTTVSDQG